jgi:hypothetical protein
LPADNGGSPVLGFFLYMKTSSEANYKMVYDGGEDPTLKTYSTNLDHNNNPIAPNTY